MHNNLRKATYNAYFYPNYKWRPILNTMGNAVNWREFDGDSHSVQDHDLITESNQQLNLF